MGAPPTTRPPSCRGGAPPAPARPARETESWRRWPRLELQNPERQATRQDPDPGRITGAAWHGTIDQNYEDPGEPAGPLAPRQPREHQPRLGEGSGPGLPLALRQRDRARDHAVRPKPMRAGAREVPDAGHLAPPVVVARAHHQQVA